MSRQRDLFWLIGVLVLFSLILAACGGASQPAETDSAAPAAESEAPAGEPGTVERVAVLLPASQTDQGWNQQAADSMTQVLDQRGGFELEIAENLGYGDITPVLLDLADRDFDLLICHASGYQTICPEFAADSGVRVAIVENPAAVSDLVADVETQAQEVAYLAGILAANMSQTGTVGVVVSGEPPTWNFMTVGFAEGVKATDPSVDVLYGVIGEAAYEDAAGAKRTTETQLAAGADIIFGMGDGASFGMLQAIEEHNAAGGSKAWFIDVIGDKSADYSDVLLSSVLFDYSGIYTQMIDEIEAGNFGDKIYNMDVASAGVRLLDLPAEVPAEVAQAVSDAQADILSGTISVSAIADAEAMRARLDELAEGAAPAAAAGTGEAVERVAVLLPASQTDQGWNQQAADSMAQVLDQRGGFELEIAENLGYGDITPVLLDLADRDFDLLICHASGYQTICPEFAADSGVRVAIVENPAAVSDLVADVETQAQEVAYLAGILAANMSQTGTVGVVVSGEPPTWNFMTVGFAEGVKATDPSVDVLYGVIGEAAYEDAAGAKRTTETQLAAGADIIFGMGDGASFGMLQAIEEHNAAGGSKAWFIDVIGDKSADYSDVLLSSVLFDYSGIYTQMIDEIEAGNFGDKIYNMDVASAGVRLLDLPAEVPADVAQAVSDAQADILSGTISVSAIADAEAMRTRLDELAEGAAPAAAGTGEAVERVAVLLPASQTDQGWNQQAADSMTQVLDQRGGFELEIAENLGYGDITPVLLDLADRDFDLLICHASGYQTICPEFAADSGVRVAIVENPAAVSDLVADVETQAQEVAYLAGILAANMSQTGTVGVVVSGEPPTWNFMTVGFAEGVKATDPSVDVLYGVIGEAAYEDAAGAKRTTETQLAAGADIIFGMGDGASFGMLQAIEEHNAAGGSKAWFIDVIGDKSADYSDVLLSSVLFDYSGIYTQMIDEIEAGNFGDKIYNMDVASGGVRLLDLPAEVPANVAQAVSDAQADILSGAISVSAIADAEAMRTRLDELGQ